MLSTNKVNFPKFFIRSLKLILGERDNLVEFDLGFVLLPTEINSISKKWGCKKYALVALGSSSIKMVFILLIKIITFHMPVFIVQVLVLSFKQFI